MNRQQQRRPLQAKDHFHDGFYAYMDEPGYIYVGSEKVHPSQPARVLSVFCLKSQIQPEIIFIHPGLPGPSSTCISAPNAGSQSPRVLVSNDQQVANVRRSWKMTRCEPSCRQIRWQIDCLWDKERQR
jgi:hypothetical protein